MKTQTNQIVLRWLKAPAIWQSEHEPFLFGNIARRGVIGRISRKAISPLVQTNISYRKSGALLCVNLAKAFLFYFRQVPDFSPGYRGKASPKLLVLPFVGITKP